MVELFLVQTPEAGPFTDFWGVNRHDWPSDVFNIRPGELWVASATSLTGYRAAFHALQPTVDGKQVSSQEWLEHHIR
ncbi:hypothetical protein E0H73_32140 [Kribbella pittospori]|uniref:Uncharacterized protein n=1 Tax=Kribbella pittospori TaxID=722689 RepID=A0A4R0KF73_9ACTN|nr:hypothetical protein [Kribbella pittospori]TCC57126.1 hypothetical protein E0H73_32140 [Kribbella pittospori]